MRSVELSTKERAALFALLAESRKLSNPELEERVGFRLDGQERRRLNNLKLVESHQTGRARAYEHELTDAGCHWCANELSAGQVPGRSTTMERALYALLAGLDRYLERNELILADIFNDRPAPQRSDVDVDSPIDADSLIKARYRELAEVPGEFVKLHDLRMKLPDIPRASLDSALDRMYQDQEINLVAQSDQRTLTDADRESALLIGGRNKHLISIGQS